jgi:hypothetical protein
VRLDKVLFKESLNSIEEDIDLLAIKFESKKLFKGPLNDQNEVKKYLIYIKKPYCAIKGTITNIVSDKCSLASM